MILNLIAVVLLFPSSRASACGDEQPSEAAFVADARAAGLAERLQALKTEQAALARELSESIEADPEYVRAAEERGRAAYGSPEYREAARRVGAIVDRWYRERFHSRYPVAVSEETFLCGHLRLPDGHEINKGSYWEFIDSRVPERQPGWRYTVNGAEMHYLLEHGRARPETFARLEALLGKPSPASGAAARRSESAMALPSLSLQVPRW